MYLIALPKRVVYFYSCKNAKPCTYISSNRGSLFQVHSHSNHLKKKKRWRKAKPKNLDVDSSEAHTRNIHWKMILHLLPLASFKPVDKYLISGSSFLIRKKIVLEHSCLSPNQHWKILRSQRTPTWRARESVSMKRESQVLGDSLYNTPLLLIFSVIFHNISWFIYFFISQ